MMTDPEYNIGWLVACFSLVVTTLYLLYWYGTRSHGYWKQKGVAYVKPLPFFGNLFDMFSMSLHDMEKTRYEKYGKIYGYYEMNSPCLSVAELDLVRSLLVKDFFSFTSRRKFPPINKLIDLTMVSLQGEDWKRIRSVVSPTFSTGKMKRVFGIFNDCAKTLVQNFKTAAEKGESVEVKSLFGTFSMDVIASSAFSVKIDSHNDPTNDFVKHAKSIFSPGGGSFNWRMILFFLAPGIARFFGIAIFDLNAADFFQKATLQVIEHRKKSGQVGNDFLQLLMDAAEESPEKDKHEEDHKEDLTSNYSVDSTAQHTVFKTVKNKHMSTDELISQCVLFFAVAYDSTASTLALASYALALNQDVQDKLRQEVDDTLAETNGEVTYEAIQGMKYLDNVISETLRMYPPTLRLERVADSDFKLGDTGITIPKGMLVGVPVYAMHMDPEYFPDPEKFDPDRFNPEERSKRPQYAYMPFGAGPRNCVAMRFALVEAKACLVHIVVNFIIKRSPRTTVPVEFIKGQGIVATKEIILDFETRDSSPLK